MILSSKHYRFTILCTINSNRLIILSYSFSPFSPLCGCISFCCYFFLCCSFVKLLIIIIISLPGVPSSYRNTLCSTTCLKMQRCRICRNIPNLNVGLLSIRPCKLFVRTILYNGTTTSCFLVAIVISRRFSYTTCISDILFLNCSKSSCLCSVWTYTT